MKKELDKDSQILAGAGVPEKLYDMYASRLLSLCLRYMGNREDAEDVLHDGFIKIIRNISRFRSGPGSNLEAWMKRIMVNTALNALRDRSRSFILVEPASSAGSIENIADEEPEPPGLFPNPGREKIMEMIRELPDGYRTVFNMYVFEEYSHREIAEALNCSENTSKSQLSKARALLRKKLTGAEVTERVK